MTDFKVGDRVKPFDGEGHVVGIDESADTAILVSVPGENDWYYSESELSLLDRPLKNFDGEEGSKFQILGDSVSFHGEPEETTFARSVHRVTGKIADLLIAKNKAYGDSALNPVRIFSKASRIEQLNVRIDDKISRIQRGTDFGDEDTVRDLIGYLVLRLIAEESE